MDCQFQRPEVAWAYDLAVHFARAHWPLASERAREALRLLGIPGVSPNQVATLAVKRSVYDWDRTTLDLDAVEGFVVFHLEARHTPLLAGAVGKRAPEAWEIILRRLLDLAPRVPARRHYTSGDVVSLSFCKLGYGGLERFDNRRRLQPFFRSVARNAERELRRMFGKAVPLPPELVSDVPDPRELVEKNEKHAHLRAAIERLPPREREMVHLKFFEELDYPEVAARLGVTKQSVHEAMRKILKKLLRFLTPHR